MRVTQSGARYKKAVMQNTHNKQTDSMPDRCAVCFNTHTPIDLIVISSMHSYDGKYRNNSRLDTVPTRA